ncbi:MAG TPA: dUTP diphosphatase, partial [Flavobacteriaceae bacterium]|nr:dUTP diphosphatase [Flavobacteriaceae bacterium]
NNSRHPEPYIIEEGDRIAQLLFVSVRAVNWSPVMEFSHTTERGAGGFGSTGSG